MPENSTLPLNYFHETSLKSVGTFGGVLGAKNVLFVIFYAHSTPKSKKDLQDVDIIVNPCHLLEAASGFEPEYGGFADLCLTTWLCRQKNGAGNGI